MDNKYKYLGVEKGASLEKIKHAYFKKVRENPPENNPEDFIKVTKAYEDIIATINEENKTPFMLAVFLENIKLGILYEDEYRFNFWCRELCKSTNLHNFTGVNEGIIDLVVFSKNQGRRWFGVELVKNFRKKFYDMHLINLAKSYDNLYLNLINGGERVEP